MKASFVELRTKSREIIRALDRNEPITILYRGRPKAIMRPVEAANPQAPVAVAAHPAFGLWADRHDLQDVTAHVRRMRKGRFNGL